MSSTVRAQWLQGVVRAKFSGGFCSVSHQVLQGLSPVWLSVSCALLDDSSAKSFTSYSPFQAKSESCSPVGAKGEDTQTGDNHL